MCFLSDLWKKITDIICNTAIGRGNFAVVGRQKSFFSGALIGPNSLFCFALVACNVENFAAHRRSLLLQQAAAQDAARTAAHKFSGGVRSPKAQCAALPDNPETRDTYHTSSSERSCAVARK